MSKYLLERVPPNPTLEYADSIKIPPGTEEIVSRGGGSTIDVGKWLSRKYGLRHTAIPTTGGTGSEVTPYVVLTVDGEKQTFTDVKFIPQTYILDPNASVSLPREHTISSGFDTLAQSLESLWSRHATMESISYATVGMELAIANIHRAVDNPFDTEARMNMLIAANMSGRAITIAPTNICHAISYPLTDLYGIPHGQACAMSLIYFADKMGFPISAIIKSLIQRVKIDRKKVAQIAIEHPKIRDTKLNVTVMDIIKSLA